MSDLLFPADELPRQPYILRLPTPDELELRHWHHKHVCTSECKDGVHVFEVELPAGAIEMLKEAPTPVERRIWHLMGRLAWLLITPEEERELIGLFEQDLSEKRARNGQAA